MNDERRPTTNDQRCERRSKSNRDELGRKRRDERGEKACNRGGHQESAGISIYYNLDVPLYIYILYGCPTNPQPQTTAKTGLRKKQKGRIITLGVGQWVISSSCIVPVGFFFRITIPPPPTLFIKTEKLRQLRKGEKSEDCTVHDITTPKQEKSKQKRFC
ncbi:hypothetical protein I7I51_04168 [Histoplasma capsulatum]|uniref:Uncharacterized protein n=1 Tax=Ajellomyces capsulatus TaxID=5037 RepID=A0A8A1M7P2_AJECA|nr:hypothetical protein I7I51_04168 [Histoplasma capsulatum]